MASNFKPEDLPTTLMITEAAFIIADIKPYEESCSQIDAKFVPSYFIPDILKRICKQATYDQRIAEFTAIENDCETVR